MAEFITSDLHLGHANIWTKAYADRPVYSTEEMNEFLISRWNETVSVNDTVYVLGDFAMGKIAESLPLAARLHGRKVLIFGNHDRMFRPKNDSQRQRWLSEYGQYFDTIQKEMVWNRILFNHFPYTGDHTEEIRYLEDRPRDRGLWLCHGHTHSKDFVSGKRTIHIGVDSAVANYAPIDLELVVETIKGV